MRWRRVGASTELVAVSSMSPASGTVFVETAPLNAWISASNAAYVFWIAEYASVVFSSGVRKRVSLVNSGAPSRVMRAAAARDTWLNAMLVACRDTTQRTGSKFAVGITAPDTCAAFSGPQGVFTATGPH